MGKPPLRIEIQETNPDDSTNSTHSMGDGERDDDFADGVEERDSSDSEADLPLKKVKADTWTPTEKETLVTIALEHKDLMKATGRGSGKLKKKGTRLCKGDYTILLLAFPFYI